MSKTDDDIDLNTPNKEILRYLNKEMSEEERYAFEKQMEADPFLYDAVQGLEGLDLAELSADLKSLKEQIRPRKKQPLPFLKIAAAIALLLVAGFSVWKLTISPLRQELASETTVNPDTLVAANEPIAKNEEADLEPLGEPDVKPIGEPVGEPVGEVREIPEDEKPSERFTQPVIAPRPIASSGGAGKPIVTGPEVADALTAEEQADFTLDDETALELEEVVTSEEMPVSDLVFDEVAAGESLGYAEDSFASGGIAEIEEAKETIALAPEPALPELRTFLRSEREDSKSMKKISEAAPKSAIRGSSEAKDDISASTPELAAPESGWVNFASFIKNNQVVSSDMQDGKVGLRFSLDENGNPEAIEVVNSLCGPCDAEAIRLLKASGKWAYYEGVTGRPATFVYIALRN